jgi:hypothetical protein
MGELRGQRMRAEEERMGPKKYDAQAHGRRLEAEERLTRPKDDGEAPWSTDACGRRPDRAEVRTQAQGRRLEAEGRLSRPKDDGEAPWSVDACGRRADGTEGERAARPALAAGGRRRAEQAEEAGEWPTGKEAAEEFKT